MKAKDSAPAARTPLIIDRAKWLRGEGSGASYLLRASDGKMCCLGFFGLTLGLGPDQLRGVEAPHSPLSPRSGWPEWLFDHAWPGRTDPSIDACHLMTENDDDASESRIAALFAKHGVDVRFVGDQQGTAPQGAKAVKEIP